MQKIYHKRNELLEVEFFENKECTIPFDFEGKEHLYIELRDGDCTPIFKLHTLGSFNIFTPYIPACISNELKHGLINTYIKTLDDIAFNLSKYIPEDNAVLFLSRQEYKDNKEQYIDMFELYETEEEYLLAKEKEPNKNHFRVMAFWDEEDKEIVNNIDNKTKFTIFLQHGTQATLQKANKIAKELNTKVNVFIKDCFLPYHSTDIFPCTDRYAVLQDYYGACKCCDGIFLLTKQHDDFYTDIAYEYINTIIITNSTGVIQRQDHERLQTINPFFYAEDSKQLQVIDCFDIFNDAL